MQAKKSQNMSFIGGAVFEKMIELTLILFPQLKPKA